MKTKIALAIALALAATSAGAALNCTNGNGQTIEWWPGMPRPNIDVTADPFICYIGGGASALDYFNQRFPGLAVQGQQTIFVGDQARFIVLNVVRATRADYDALTQ